MLSVAAQTPPNAVPPMALNFPCDRFMRLPEVIHTTGLSRSTIYDLISRRQFPAQLSLGGKNVAWLASEIDGWMRERIAARYQGAQS
ncbi:AlpA family transcriptional regulator [Rouxiella badensis]|uniref:helix-turn-helix transcriptional regulator n=1 Tax=Rouxiella badensis TaxID=1646377 RepID=UPI0013EEEA5A|nr:AlpA family transcriptional regulator [Rouxiella badensis]QII36615.1 AlpA family transcriptional regulator [Rouxiella badensis]